MSNAQLLSIVVMFFKVVKIDACKIQLLFNINGACRASPSIYKSLAIGMLV